MPDIINASGLTVETSTEITAAIVAGMQLIYGTSINTDQNSPDGQMIGILTQMAVDIRELIVSVNNGFDPDQAIGAILDERVTINNIQRQGGSYTIQPITINCNTTVTLPGLDAAANNPNGTGFTVQDSSGNQYILQNTVTLTAGVYPLNFRAKLVGLVNVPVNTLTVPLTIVQGVTSVNNPSSAITVGQNQETDIQLRTRRARSPALLSSGYLNGLLAKILALSGVTEAVLYENNSGTTDSNGIPAHSIWLIVGGGASVDIANTIYKNKSFGGGMTGAVTYNITTVSGGLFVAKWDVPVSENLYIKFNLKKLVTGFTFNTATIASYIATNLVYAIGQIAETSGITLSAIAGIASQGGGGVPIDVLVSVDNATWLDYIATATLASQFTLDPSRIFITVV